MVVLYILVRWLGNVKNSGDCARNHDAEPTPIEASAWNEAVCFFPTNAEMR
jgi:hypothetical protein